MVKTHKVDLLIVGSGSGLNLIPNDWKVAIVERGALGGTCLNRGCIPSKILIHSADVAETINNAKKFGINAKINSIDFAKITAMASNHVDESSKKIEQGLKSDENIMLFKGTGKFISERTMQVGDDVIKADKVIIAAGARPMIPNIPGLDKVNYITSTEALRLKKQPKSMTIIGGGYIACELAHFYGALGTKINIIQRSEHLLSREDDEIAEKFTEVFKIKYNVLTNATTQKVSKKNGKFVVEVKTPKGKKTLVSEQLLVAMGVTPNADTLDCKKSNIMINDKGYISVNEYFETSAKNVWAFGDIIGTTMLKHGANYESEIVYQNAIANKKTKADYTAMPHAIFSSPQIAGVGFTEQELKEKKIDYVVGKHSYIKTGMGLALQDKDGFVKILVHARTRKILGCHILGENAANMMHEILVAMRHSMQVDALSDIIYIHPALGEVIQRAVNNIEWEN